MPANTTSDNFHQALSKSLPKLLKCSAGVFVTFFVVAECLIVIIALLRSKKFLNRQTQINLFNVTLVDLLNGVFIVPPLTVIEISSDLWIYSPRFCIYWLTVGSLLLNVRVLALFIVSMDRYMSVCHPMRYSTILTFSRARLIIILSWCVATTLLIPQMAVAVANQRSVISPQNLSNGYLPLDWVHSTSNAFRGIFALMFVLRILLPLIGAIAITILALRVVVASSRGFQEGFIKVKDPNLHVNIPTKTLTITQSQHQITAEPLPRKTILMRIHRGNYMTDGTKELFAQLPLTSRAQSARLSRRAAMLPNVEAKVDFYEKNTLKRAQTLCQKISIPSTSFPVHEETQKSDPENSTHPTCISTSSSELREEDPTQPTAENPLDSKNDDPLTWWQTVRSRISSSKNLVRKRRLQDLGSILPLGSLLLVFLIFSLPYQIVQFIRVVWLKVPLPSDVNSYLYWLACANSILNPLILTFWSTSFRSKVLHIITCGRFHPKKTAIKRLIIASFGTANLPYGSHVRQRDAKD